MVVNGAIFDGDDAEATDDADGILAVMPLDLGMREGERAVFFDPDGGDDGIAGLDEVVETEDAVVDLGLAPLEQDDDVLHLVGSHPIHELAFQLFYILVMLENIQNMLVFHEFLLQVAVRIPAVRKLHPCDLALVVVLRQLDVHSHPPARQDHHSDLVALFVHIFGFEPHGFAAWVRGYVMTRFYS